ncbi:inward rectifier potassium channel irk-1-like [Anthonomus grandis grandis]|uniref:inward rectifier potassium channel irk-1-like n=1 Tax=Anthonomus grandis grandis TaxID=2921223 RepID=UPI002165D99B|nr:inward rectifier potassium channel irk-1-like [Anthonomus grandis grandis]
MSTENDVLLNFLEREKENRFDFPVILKTHHSMNGKYDTLRRNIPLNRSHSYYHKRDARLVNKRGRIQVYFKGISNKSMYYAKDLWNTLVNMQWRWLILIVAVVNTLAYFVCALLFYFDSWVSGDSEIIDGLGNSTICIIGTKNIVEYFMLGIETITTTGYGYLHPTEYCQLFILVLTFSTLTSITIDGAFVSVVYAKLNKPKENNIYGQIFSKKGVISLRNNKLCLVIKINDRDGRHWIHTDIHIYFVRELITDEGDITLNYFIELDIQPFGMPFWPIEIVHVITASSPLWEISAEELMTTKLEIILVISGSSVKTGQPTKSQCSYLNKEIMWGCQFGRCLEYDPNKQEYLVNKKLFHQTVPQEVPLCSAKVLEDLRSKNLFKTNNVQSV